MGGKEKMWLETRGFGKRYKKWEEMRKGGRK